MILTTEQPSEYERIDNMSTRQILQGINQQDARVPGAVEKAIPQIEALVNQLVARMQQGGRLFYIGAGTSGRLGVVDASEIPPTYGMPQGVVIGVIAGGDGAIRVAVEGAEDDPGGAWRDLAPHKPGPRDTVIGIAASGTTPYVIGGLRDARAAGLLTGAVVCNVGSPVAAAAEYPVEVVVGPEFVTGSTRMKAGTAQKLVLNMISTAVMIRLGRVEGNRMVNMQLTNRKLVARGTRMIVEATGLDSAIAGEMLALHGSVKRAVTAFDAERVVVEAAGGAVVSAGAGDPGGEGKAGGAVVSAGVTGATGTTGVTAQSPVGQTLMIFRRGMWDLPKGHVERGETARQAALREVAEECGLDPAHLVAGEQLAVTTHAYRNPAGRFEQKRTTWYRMSYSGNPATARPQTEEDITAVEWMAPEEALRRARESYPTIRAVIEKLTEKTTENPTGSPTGNPTGSPTENPTENP